LDASLSAMSKTADNLLGAGVSLDDTADRLLAGRPMTDDVALLAIQVRSAP